MVLVPTSQALWGSGANCLSSVGTYLLGTVGQGCRLFNWCLNLPPGTVGQVCRLFKRSTTTSLDCGAGVQAVYTVSEPTICALWTRGAGCLSPAGPYLRGTVGQGLRLFNRCLNLPPMHCVAAVQAV